MEYKVKELTFQICCLFVIYNLTGAALQMLGGVVFLAKCENFPGSQTVAVMQFAEEMMLSGQATLLVTVFGLLVAITSKGYFLLTNAFGLVFVQILELYYVVNLYLYNNGGTLEYSIRTDVYSMMLIHTILFFYQLLSHCATLFIGKLISINKYEEIQ